MKKAFCFIFLFLFSTVLTNHVYPQNSDTLGIQDLSVVFELKPQQTESTLDKFLTFIKDILGPLVALIGILIARPFLKKKLLENHISNTLTKIHETNSEVLKLSQKLIDNYAPLTYENKPLTLEDIEAVSEEVKNVYYLAQNGSSDVVSLLFYLKSAIQGVIRNYNKSTQTRLISGEFHGLIIRVLKDVSFYCTQVIQAPKSTKTKTNFLIKKELRKYVTHSEFTKYKHFNQGIINDPQSAHFLSLELHKKCNYLGIYITTEA